MVIPVTQTEFDKLRSALKLSQDVALQEDTPLTGTLTTSDVVLGYHFSTEKGEMQVTVLKRRSFKAKLAPDSTIEGKVKELLGKFLS